VSIALDKIKFGPDGLIPAVVQSPEGEVRMVGHMNADALSRTLETGWVTFWSRSRQEIWVKGETSGNRLKFLRGRPGTPELVAGDEGSRGVSAAAGQPPRHRDPLADLDQYRRPAPVPRSGGPGQGRRGPGGQVRLPAGHRARASPGHHHPGAVGRPDRDVVEK